MNTCGVCGRQVNWQSGRPCDTCIRRALPLERCPGCHRSQKLYRQLAGRVCNRCYVRARETIEKCATCAKVRHINAAGRCAACQREAREERTCTKCGTSGRRWSNARNPVCQRCWTRNYRALHGRKKYPVPCGICGRVLANNNRLDGKRLCVPCYRRLAPDERCEFCLKFNKLIRRRDGVRCCAGCYAKVKMLGVCARCGSERCVYGKRGAKRCQACRRAEGWTANTRTALTSTACPECGVVHIGRAGSRCRRCVLDRELRSLLSDAQGKVPEVLEPFRQYLLQRCNEHVIDWVRKLSVRMRGYFEAVAAGTVELSEETLCALGPGPSTRDLLSRLVAAQVFRQHPIEDVETEAWLRAKIFPLLPNADRHTLLQYFRFHAIPSAIARANARTRYDARLRGFRCIARVATKLFCYLAQQDTTLALCTQRLFDAHLAALNASQRTTLTTFIHWAKSNKLCTISSAHVLGHGEVRLLSDTQMFECLALIDQGLLDAGLRLAAMLVWIYGLGLATIVQLRGANVSDTEETTTLQLQTGATIFVVEPVRSTLLAALPAKVTDWLFPSSRYPTHHVGPQTLKRALRAEGLLPYPTTQICTTAKRRLLSFVPAALAREVLGINSATAANAVGSMASPSAQQYVGLRVRAVGNTTA